jgi:hypothetical protein
MDELDFGSTVSPKESDYILKETPTPFFTFQEKKIEYNQKLVSAYSCTIHGAAGVVSDLTGYSYSTDELQKLWQKAINLGARPDYGWSLSEAVDLVRKNWNSRHDKKLLSFRVDRLSQKFWETLKKGYSAAVAFRGNSTYNNDKNDGQLDETNFGATTYGHIVRVAWVDERLTIIDNYKGITHNTYTIPTEHWADLSNFFASAYFFMSEDEYRRANDQYQVIPSWADESWKEYSKLFDNPLPSAPITIDQVQWTLHKLGIVQKPTEPLTQARWAVILNRMLNN